MFIIFHGSIKVNPPLYTPGKGKDPASFDGDSPDGSLIKTPADQMSILFFQNLSFKLPVKILSRLLGHADVNITYNIYIHLYSDGFDEMHAALVSEK